MYKLPNNYDLSILNGAIINQISFALNNVVISFRGGIGYIQIESSFALSNQNGQMITHDIYPVTKDNGLLKLLEQKIISAQANDTKTNLILRLEDGNVLEVISDPMYESYFVSMHGSEIRI